MIAVLRIRNAGIIRIVPISSLQQNIPRPARGVISFKIIAVGIAAFRPFNFYRIGACSGSRNLIGSIYIPRHSYGGSNACGRKLNRTVDKRIGHYMIAVTASRGKAAVGK